MLSKARVKNMLSKRLSGKEAGRLWFMDSWEVERGREGFLSEADHAHLRKSLTTAHDIEDFNKSIELFRAIQYLVGDAHVAFLQALLALEELDGVYRDCALNFLALRVLLDLPLIVTEKQLQRLKAQQKRARKKKLHCLEEVYQARARALAEEETGLYWEDVEEEVWDKCWTQGAKEIDALIKSRKLRPQKLDSPLAMDSDDRAWISFAKDEPPEEQERLLQTAFPGEGLAKAGLPEWTEDIEEFRLFYLPEQDWYGDDPPEALAVIQEDLTGPLPPVGLGAKDFQPVLALRYLRDITGLRFRGQHDFSSLLATAKDRISTLAARRQALREAAPLVGTNTAEDVDRFYALLEERVSSLNEKRRLDGAAERVIRLAAQAEGASGGQALEALLKEPPIELEKIKPTARELRASRSILAEQLGKNWWSQPAEEGNDHAE